MDTFFAPPERATAAALEQAIQWCSHHPVVDGIMSIVNGMLVILNKERQIVSVNDVFLKSLALDNPESVFGMRPGEVLGCDHADLMQGGCGTSEYCSSCGAILAVLTSMAENRPTERLGAIKATREGRPVDFFIQVRACPITINQTRFVVVLIQDMTVQQQWNTLEKVFFHDISNIATALVGRSELWQPELGPASIGEIHDLSLRLTQEIQIQKQLVYSDVRSYQPIMHSLSLPSIVSELAATLRGHKAALKRKVEVQQEPPDITVLTDRWLLLRVLLNMGINALEATQPGGRIRIWLEDKPDGPAVAVWNDAYIPSKIARRIFQRNHTTKEGFGRGLGTYAMKLLGQEILNGRVDFTTSEEMGTTFRYHLRY
ncbi:MAG: HAMP domain-containing sensor histidine kinase [bacterium]